MEKKSKIISAIITAVISGVISEIYTTFKPISLLINFLQEPVILKMWGFILIIIALPIFVIIVMYAIAHADPDYFKYTSDNFYDINWHWNWYENSIRNLIALCPKCHYQMTQEVKGYYCDKCGKKIANQYNPSNAEMESIVERMIHQRVRIKEYI
ncbi:MAG TPA: hypothetical protein DCM73_14980 [Clostridiales bacterium]|nr:hypothetical protein [Clostridiales bacterium]